MHLLEFFKITEAPMPSSADIARLRPTLIKLIQQEYNEWEQGEDDELGGGGICQNFAQIIADGLNDAGIEATTMSAAVGEQHVFAVAQASDGVFEVDIPFCIYERGGGYSWEKIPDVVFQPDDIVINQLSANPADFEQYGDDGW